MTKLEQATALAKDNFIVVDALTKADSVINHGGYKNIVIATSGGSDSDIVMDLIERVRDDDVKVTYVWYNTGIEYQASKDHLAYLEDKYNITIKRIMSKVPVPLGVKKYGMPFLSKRISEDIGRLQAHGFDFTTTDDYETLNARYPRCVRSLKWWTNYDGEDSRFSIANRRGLKEFLQANPPPFITSDKCCKGAKKDVIHDYAKTNGVDLVVIGVRKAEGGNRSTGHKSCISVKTTAGYAQYRPLFWFAKADKEFYDKIFGVTHSECYTKYHLKRTGCAGCPFAGKNMTAELEAIKEYEPKLYNAVHNIFGPAYEYTQKYYEFMKNLKK